jgi:serine protease AprX
MRTFFTHLFQVTTFSCLALVAHANPSQQEPLRVMLQGTSAAELEVLVTSKGGSTTHLLPIINSVGAIVSLQQLNSIMDSPLVTRVIDDLSTAEEPEESIQAQQVSCEVGGALELTLNDTGLSWTIYNKSGNKTRLQSLEISWPLELGDINSLSWDGQELDSAHYPPNQGGELTVKLPPTAQANLNESAILSATFDAEKTGENAKSHTQSDFTITATFGEECATQLIPGYIDNDQNTYFPTVIGADELHRHNITGRGVTVAIIDSGLWEVPELANDTQGRPRIVARYDAIADVAGKQTVDETGHGTHLTSVIAHSGKVTQSGKEAGSFKGVAPDVNLVAIKAFNVAGQGDMLDIVRAVQFVVDHKQIYNIKVLNLSFAARPRWPYWEDPINQAVMKAWAAGITVVAAAGNEGPEPMTIGSPGNLPYLIPVGAVTDSWTLNTRDDDYIPDFSSRGPTPSAHIKPDIVAPGGHMTGLAPPGSSLTLQHPDYVLSTGEFVMTGTSQASALVAGLAALLLQLEPDLTPDDVKCKLISSAEVAINKDNLLAYSPFQQGNGYVSATRAITLGQRGCGNLGLDIEKDILNLDHFEGPAIILGSGEASLPGLETMLSAAPADKGMSVSRKWGVKAHIERDDDEPNDPNSIYTSAFDWQSSYQNEKLQIEKLAAEPQR